MRTVLIATLGIVAALGLYLALDFSRVSVWAVTAQRDFQNTMATAILALKSGDQSAFFALCTATFAYGFVHALGPGHGKYLVGGMGVGTQVSTARLTGLAVLSSLAQSLWAILLVYGGFAVFEATAHQMTNFAEDILAPLSYLAIASIGLYLIWRGLRALRKPSTPCCEHHAHGPTVDEVQSVSSLRDALALIASIAVRPCTGAIFLLVIAWQMDVRIAGALAVMAMGFGTAGLTGVVAVSSVKMRDMASSASGSLNLSVTLPMLQICAGTIVVLISFGMLGLAV